MRVLQRVLAAVLALALLILCVVAIAEIILAALDRPSWLIERGTIADDLGQRTWEDEWVRVVSVAAVLLGLLLFYAGLARSAPTDLPMDSDDEQLTMSLSRKSLERYLATVATTQPGVARSKATARRGRVIVRAETPLPAAEVPVVRERVTEAVSARLAPLNLARQPKISVSVHRRKS